MLNIPLKTDQPTKYFQQWLSSKTTSPQSHLRKAHRSSADKKNSKLLELHSPVKSRSSPNYIDCARAVRRCWNMAVAWWPPAKWQLWCLLWCVFALGFLFNPQFDLEPDYIIRKGIWRRIQRYIPRREMSSTFHTQVDCRSLQWSVRHLSIGFHRCENSKPAGNSLFPLSVCPSVTLVGGSWPYRWKLLETNCTNN